MKILILLLLTISPLLGSDFLTFKSEEGAECTYHKYKLSAMSGVEALMSAEGDYIHSQYIKIYVRDAEKFFPELVKMNVGTYYKIYVEKKGAKYVAIKGRGPFSQKASTSGLNKSNIADMPKKNCQILIDLLLDFKMIPTPNEKTNVIPKKPRIKPKKTE